MTKTQRHNGFTLIEVIITIVIAASLGLLIFTFLGNIMTRSHEPLFTVQERDTSVSEMEAITYHYQEYLYWRWSWADFTNWLAAQGLTPEDMSQAGGGDFNGDPFTVLRVTVTSGEQSAVALFTR